MKLCLFKLKVSSPIAASTFILGDMTERGENWCTLKNPIFAYEMITPEAGFIMQAGKKVSHNKINIGYSYAPCDLMTQGSIALDREAWDWWREIDKNVLDQTITDNYLRSVKPYTEMTNEPSNGGVSRGFSATGVEPPVV